MFRVRRSVRGVWWCEKGRHHLPDFSLRSSSLVWWTKLELVRVLSCNSCGIPNTYTNSKPGTDATIAQHILTIQNRKYAFRVHGNLFKPSPLGMALCEGFAAMGRNDLAKPYLRANMEASCNDICNGTKSRLQVVRSTLIQMRQVFKQMKDNADELTSAVARHLNLTPSRTPIVHRAQIRPPSNPRTVRRSLSKCGKCGEMMALVSASSSNSNSKRHFLRCSSSMCT